MSSDLTGKMSLISDVASPNKEMISLCLTGAGLGRRHVLKIPPEATVQELLDECQRVVFGREDASDNKQTAGRGRGGAGQCQLQHGFPPRAIDPTKLNNCSLRDAGIQNQDRIDVTIVANLSSSETPAKKGDQARKKGTKTPEQSSLGSAPEERATDPPTGTPPVRNKRAAARAAEASFADTIRQQDELARSERQSPSSRAGKKKVNSSSSQPTAAKFNASSTVGRRLNDGCQVTPRKRKQATTSAAQSRANSNDNDDKEHAGMSREEAGAMALLRALDGGAATDTASKRMRSEWKKAVNSAYEQNQAVARLAAVSSGIIKMELDGVVTGANGGVTPAAATLVVTYPKGVQGRGDYVDRVDYLPLDVLQSVIAAIHPQHPETLRSENLALLSPRVLWSLVYHVRTEQRTELDSNDVEGTEGSVANVAPVSVEAALQKIQPDLDWAFLRRRKEQLSEKARENLRQQREAEGSVNGEDWDAAAAAIESVENAMESLSALHRSQRAARLSQAATRRVTWNVVTPDEVDEDELRECVGESVPPGSVGPITQSLLRHGIRNWRELANADSSHLVDKLKDFSIVSEEIVQGWIDRAQEESIEEIMVEVCGGSVAAVELLREVNSGTPRDLAMWETIAPSLHSALLSAVRDGSESAKAHTVPSVDELQQWCGRAQCAIRQLSWIGMLTTPV